MDAAEPILEPITATILCAVLVCKFSSVRATSKSLPGWGIVLDLVEDRKHLSEVRGCRIVVAEGEWGEPTFWWQV